MSGDVLRPSRLLIGLLSLLLLLALVAVLAGCSDDTSGGTTSSSVGTATSETASSTTTPSTPQLTVWDKELAKTAQIQNQLTGVLTAQQAPENDPRRGLAYGLHARTLAIACRQALDKKDLKSADSSMLQVYQNLNMSKGVATGAVAKTIADARAIIAGIGAPSDAPDKAAPLLEQFITATAPLLDAALADIPSTTST